MTTITQTPQSTSKTPTTPTTKQGTITNTKPHSRVSSTRFIWIVTSSIVAVGALFVFGFLRWNRK